MGDTCTVGNAHEHVVFRQAVHVMVHVCSQWRAAGEEFLDVSSGFKCGFNGLSRPCRPHAVVCYFFLKMA